MEWWSSTNLVVICKRLTEFWPFFDLGLDIFGRINFTFLQNYYISQRVTISHDYPVPVDKHNRD